MSIKVKVKTPSLKQRIKALKKFDNVVFKVATRMKSLLFQNWSGSKGADDKKFDALSMDYKEKKEESGRHGVRNMLYSGNMAQDLDPVKAQDFKYILKFRSAKERKKARGNHKYADNMMLPISERINKKLQTLAYNLYRGK